MKKIILWKMLVLFALLAGTLTVTAQTWLAKTDFINGESLSAYAFTINDTVYVGNTGGTGFYQYNYVADAWSAKADAPAAMDNRTNSTGFTINGKGYVLGGTVAPGVCVADVWEYNPATDSWTQKANFPGGKRAGASCFVIGNKAYIGGGFDTIDISGFSPIPKNDFWQYDPTTDVWTPKSALPYDSSYLLQPFSFSINGKGYISCGDRVRLSAGVYHDTDVNSTFEYDTTANSWTQKANFPGPVRSGGVSFVIGNMAYCGTGIDDTSSNVSGNCYSDLYSYDPAANTWASLPAPPFAPRTYAIAATVSTGKAFVGTGWFSPTTTTYYKDWWEFIPAANHVQEISHAAAELICYTGPDNGSFSINVVSALDEQAEITVTSINGDLVSRFYTRTNCTQKVDVHIATGIYVVTATLPDQVCHKKLFIK